MRTEATAYCIHQACCNSGGEDILPTRVCRLLRNKLRGRLLPLFTPVLLAASANGPGGAPQSGTIPLQTYHLRFRRMHVQIYPLHNA